jgi:hypothetical protein
MLTGKFKRDFFSNFSQQKPEPAEPVVHDSKLLIA